jgi:hypothetical protein
MGIGGEHFCRVDYRCTVAAIGATETGGYRTGIVPLVGDEAIVPESGGGRADSLPHSGQAFLLIRSSLTSSYSMRGRSCCSYCKTKILGSGPIDSPETRSNQTSRFPNLRRNKGHVERADVCTSSLVSEGSALARFFNGEMFCTALRSWLAEIRYRTHVLQKWPYPCWSACSWWHIGADAQLSVRHGIMTVVKTGSPEDPDSDVVLGQDLLPSDIVRKGAAVGHVLRAGKKPQSIGL